MRLAAIIAAGLLSRAVHTNWVLIDKYLGDALYAAMVYEIVRLIARPTRNRNAMMAMGIMLAIESFQLTLLPARWVAGTSPLLQIAGRLLGTHFSWLDLAAYAAGIAGICLLAPGAVPHDR